MGKQTSEKYSQPIAVFFKQSQFDEIDNVLKTIKNSRDVFNKNISKSELIRHSTLKFCREYMDNSKQKIPIKND